MNAINENVEVIARKTRLLWQINDQYKKFYWFEMKNNDLYWGPSGKSPKEFVYEEIENCDHVTLTIPESISFNEKVNTKFSYHESGEVHMKQEYSGKPEYHKINKCKIPEKILEPKRFFTLITKPVERYEVYRKKITKDDSNAIVFKINEDQLANRFYFEFFISPEGNFAPPPTLIKMNTPFAQPQIKTESLNNKFILVIRHNMFGGTNDWRPENEIFFFEDI